MVMEQETNPTNWYTYTIVLPEAAQSELHVSLSDRTEVLLVVLMIMLLILITLVSLNLEYEKIAETSLVFVPSEGKMAVADDVQQYDVRGEAGSTYISGIFANDSTLTLSSSNLLYLLQHWILIELFH